jgi:hypothetical protein
MQSAEASSRNRRHVQFISRRRSTLRRFLSAFGPTNPAVLNSRAGTRTPFLTHRTRQEAYSIIIFGFTPARRERHTIIRPCKGMSIVLEKVRENLRRRSDNAHSLE